MKVIDQSFEIDHFEPEEDIRRITRAARICYKSDNLATHEERCKFVDRLKKRNPENPHMSPFEHSSLSVVFVTNRGVSHEMVRHRLMSPNQESSRYCCYEREKFGNEVIFIRDSAIPDEGPGYLEWLAECQGVEKNYFRRLDWGYSTDTARNALSNDVKTELIITTNYREWRHILKLRCSKEAHYQMREAMIPVLKFLKKELPCVFDDIPYWDDKKVAYD